MTITILLNYFGVADGPHNRYVDGDSHRSFGAVREHGLAGQPGQQSLPRAAPRQRRHQRRVRYVEEIRAFVTILYIYAIHLILIYIYTDYTSSITSSFVFISNIIVLKTIKKSKNSNQC